MVDFYTRSDLHVSILTLLSLPRSDVALFSLGDSLGRVTESVATKPSLTYQGKSIAAGKVACNELQGSSPIGIEAMVGLSAAGSWSPVWLCPAQRYERPSNGLLSEAGCQDCSEMSIWTS